MESAINNLLSPLTEDEKQLLKDTINFGAWGDTDISFINDKGDIEEYGAYGYCTNDASKAGHFSGRKVSAMFRSIYFKLCPANHNQVGSFLTHYSDWWGDGTGDMLFIISPLYRAFENWARND